MESALKLPATRTSTAIPHAEVWTPTRSMIYTLPVLHLDSARTRHIQTTPKQRGETESLRKLWLSLRELPVSHLKQDNIVTQYKRLLKAREQNVMDYKSRGEKDRIFELDMSDHQKKAGCKVQETNQNRFKPASKNRDAKAQVKLLTLSEDWVNEIKKKPQSRCSFSSPISVVLDEKKINREVHAKQFIKKSASTYFYKTFEVKPETFTIHHEFDSENNNCWDNC